MSLYSKEIMEHFKNPKNVGRMKNPSCSGRAGNMVCLLPRQNIHINNDLKEIDKIFPGERVLSHNGGYNKVNKIAERNYNGEVLIIKNKLGKIQLTPEHLVLAIKPPKGDRFLRTKNRRLLPASWYHAEDLKRGDIVLYPILKEKKDCKYVVIDIPKLKWDFRSKEIPSKIPLNSDLLRLFGYFLSEGNVQDKLSRTFISFSLNINEEGIAEDINKISKKLFNLNVKIRRLLGRKTIIVSLYSARLARLFKKLFNNGAGNKMLPDFIMNLPAKKQIPLIYSLWRGDGYINVDRVGPRAGYSTISYKLAQQIKMLLLRQKIIPSIYKEKAREIRGLKHREAYRIHIGQRDSLKRLALILGIKYYPKSYISEKGWLDNNFLYTPITGIIKKQYQGKVYNLEVESSHSFTSEAFCVHNCGDIMYLYLKIEKNKAGKEIIKDIKFETFGCTVAIANTSLLTTMVKGKTLEYASKITKEDLIKKFKQVPLIKIHCSLLAVDALSEAIYDYFKKQGRPITPELQAKHERIEKEEKEIEHKHEGLVELEEKLHKK